MIVTETEAKTKWCRNVRVTGASHICQTSWNRIKNREQAYREAGTHCIASECMAWVWIDKEKSLGACGEIQKPDTSQQLSLKKTEDILEEVKKVVKELEHLNLQ